MTDDFQAFRIREAGKGVAAGFERMTVDALDAGEVVVRVAYSSVNYKDALAATGKGRIIRRFPCTGGIDLSGTVVASTDPRFTRGDAVIATSYDLGVSHDGGYATYARVPADWVVPLPRELTLFDAMVYGTAGFTAGLAVVRMEANGLAPANGPIVVTGATGGVGSLAIAILARLGYHVVALTGKAHEAPYLERLGAREVMLRESIDLAKMRPLDTGRWAGAVDNLGGPVLAWLLSTMQQGAPVASIGLAASSGLETTVMPFILRGVSLLGIDSGYAPMPIRREVWRRLATDMRPADLSHVARTIPFRDLPGAFDDFIAGRVRGRLVVDLSGD
jgi:putative YhdH/YhfP family quinone oxidoreductase